MRLYAVARYALLAVLAAGVADAQINFPPGIAVTSLTGDVTATAAGVTTVGAISGVTVAGTTGTGNVVFSAAPTLTGTTLVAGLTASGAIQSANVNVIGATVPLNGIYRPLANQLALSTATTQAVLIDATQGVKFNAQMFAPALTQTSVAQTGTLCWTTGTGAITVDTTVACLASSARFKMHDKPLDIGLDAVMKMRPVSYDLRPEFNPTHLGRQVGLMAEEVGAIDERLIGRDGNGDIKGVRYMQLTAVLVRAIQDQQREIDELKKALGR